MAGGANAQTVLEVKNLSVSFGAVKALIEVNLGVRGGEVLALVGDNGAGKSTLVKVLAGIVRPDAGHLLMDGHPVALRSPRDATGAGIATVFQDLALCENLDVVANLFLGQEIAFLGGPLALLNEPAMEVRAREILESLHITSIPVRSQVSRLSGGQRQAIAIARAMVGLPRVLLLDEPTAALGVAQTAEVLKLVRRVRERGVAVVLISHNMENVREVADRIHVLRLARTSAIFAADVAVDRIVAAITGAATTASAGGDAWVSA